MAYSNVTPPTLPSYDSVANPYYLIQFEYALGAENWETVRFWYGAAPLTWNGSAVTNSADCYCQTYGTGSPEWTAWGVMAPAGEMALTPGATTADTYIRIYTNHDILDGTGAVWLAEGKVTPTESDKEAEIQIRKKSQLAGIIAAWCAPVRQFPKPTAEPVAFLYNGVRLPGLPVVVYPCGLLGIEQYSDGFRYYFIASDTPFTAKRYDSTPEKVSLPFMTSVPAVYSLDDTGKWVEQTSLFSALEVVWVNHDLYDQDDSAVLLMKATEPVPVYEVGGI